MSKETRDAKKAVRKEAREKKKEVWELPRGERSDARKEIREWKKDELTSIRSGAGNTPSPVAAQAMPQAAPVFRGQSSTDDFQRLCEKGLSLIARRGQVSMDDDMRQKEIADTRAVIRPRRGTFAAEPLISAARAEAGIKHRAKIRVTASGIGAEMYAQKDGWHVDHIRNSWRLVDPKGYRYLDCDTAEMTRFFEAVIRKEQNCASMLIYRVIHDREQGNIDTRGNYEVLSMREAQEEFPRTVDLTVGFYTIHPKDEQVLVPILNYFSSLALSQEDECYNLLRQMGATKVEISRYDESRKNNKSAADVSVIGFVDVDAKLSIVNNLKTSNNLRIVFNSAAYTKPPADLLEQSIWFRDSSLMNGILLSRLSEANRMRECDIETSLESDFNFDFHAATDVLNIAKGELETEYASVKNQTRHFHVAFA
jgi:hypothetical protein